MRRRVAIVVAALGLIAAGVAGFVGSRWDLVGIVEMALGRVLVSGTADVAAARWVEGGLRVEGVVLRDVGGVERVRVGWISVAPDWSAWGRGAPVLAHVRANDVRVDISRDDEGRAKVAGLFVDPAASGGSGGVDLGIADIVVEGLLLVDGTEAPWGELAVRGALWGEHGRWTAPVEIRRSDGRVAGAVTYGSETLSVRALRGELPGVVASGALAWGDVVGGAVAVDLDLGVLSGDAGWVGDVSLAVEASGTPQDVGLVWRLAGDAGSLSGVGRWSGASATVEGRHPRITLREVWPKGPDVVAEGTFTMAVREGGVGFTWNGDTTVEGRDLRAASVRGRWADGALDIDGLRFDGVVGQVEGTGRWADGQSTWQVRAALDPAALEALGAPDLVGDGVFGGQIDVASDGGVAVAGRLDWRGGQWGGVDVDQLGIGVDLRVVEGRVDGWLDLDASGLALGDLAASAASDGRIELHVAPDRIRAKGRTVVTEMEAGGVSFERADVGWSFDRNGETKVAFGGVDLGAGTALGQALDGGRIAWFVGPEQTTVTGEITSYGDPWLFIDGRRDAASRWLVRDLRFLPSRRVSWALKRPASWTEVPGGVADVDLALTGPVGDIAVTGTMGSQGPLSGRVRVTGLLLDVASELDPDRFDGLSGTLDLDLDASGMAEAPDVAVVVTLRKAWWPDRVRWLDVDGTVAWRDGQLRPDLHLGIADVPLAHIGGELALAGSWLAPVVPPNGSLGLWCDLLAGSIDRLVHAFPALDGLPKGDASARIRLDGRRDAPRLSVDGVAVGPVAGWRDPGRIEVALAWQEGHWSGAVDLREGLATRAWWNGTARQAMPESSEPPSITDLDIEGDLRGVPVSRLAALAGWPMAVDGDLRGEVAVRGSLDAPLLSGDLVWADGRLGEADVLALRTTWRPLADGGVSVFVDGDVGVGHFAATGTIPHPVTGAGPWGLEVTGTELPLGVVVAAWPDVRDVGGTATLRARMVGDKDAPEVSFDADVKDGALIWSARGLSISDVQLRFTGDERALRLERFQAHTSPMRLEAIDGRGSWIRASGALRRGADDRFGFSGQIRLDDGAWVSSTPDLGLRLEGALVVSGTWPEVDVTGDVAVDMGRVAIDTASDAAAAPRTLDARIVVHRGRDVEEAIAEVVASAVDLDMNMRVDLGRNVEIDLAIPFVDRVGALGAAVGRLDLDARLGGELDVDVDGGEWTVLGDVEVYDGVAGMLQSRFELDRGTLAFAGGDPLEPELNLEAHMGISGGGRVDLRVRGRPTAPKVALTSDITSDPSQVMAMVLTGRAPDDLGSDATAGALAGLVLGGVVGATPLQALRVAPDGSVIVGVPVGRRVYLESIIDARAAVGENDLTLAAEVGLGNRLVLAPALGYPKSWVDLAWEVRF